MAVPLPFLALLAAGVFALGVFGLRGLLDIHAALRTAELDRLDAPPHWLVTRAACGAAGAVPAYLAAQPLGGAGLLAAAMVAALGYAVAPHFLASARERVAREVLDDLPLHLDLMALCSENGATLPGALATCAEFAPEGALRRAWPRVILEIHAGADPLDALRAMEQRLSLRSFGTLVSALRAAQRLSLPLAPVLRDKARHTAANRFARAEHAARVAPLKLWATLMLCIAPCTLVVLAFPVAQMLARLAG